MNGFSHLVSAQSGQELLGVALTLAGVWLFGRGLLGGRGGHRGLLRGHEPALARAEGWRTVVTGVVVAGLGFAALTGSPLLFYLFLGIGIVELWEASFVISVWRHADTHKTRGAQDALAKQAPADARRMIRA